MCPCRHRYARLDTIKSDSSAEARAAISMNSTGGANTELAQAAAAIDMSMAGLQPTASGLDAARAAEALGLITEDSGEELSASNQLAEQVSQGLLRILQGVVLPAPHKALVVLTENSNKGLPASGLRPTRQETVCIDAGSRGHAHLMVLCSACQEPLQACGWERAQGLQPMLRVHIWLGQNPASGCDLPASPRPT